MPCVCHTLVKLLLGAALLILLVSVEETQAKKDYFGTPIGIGTKGKRV